MNKEDATKVLQQIKAVCIKNNLWFTVETDNRPEPVMIKIKEISIKIDK